jgi:glycosyltransferase involved in cell wall biosynthesis
MVAASPFPYPQGSQVLISQLAAGLQRRGHEVQVVSYHCGVGQSPKGVAIHRIRALPGLGLVKARPSWRKPFLDLLLARKLLHLVRRWQPDVMHTHNFEGLLAALYVRRRTGTPTIYHVHNAMGLELHTYFRSRLGQWTGKLVGRWVDANLPKRADYCIVLHDGAVGYFQERAVDHLRVIPPGIDFEPGKAATIRQRWGGEPIVLYSGNLDGYQDLDLLLQVFQLVLDARPEAKLVFSVNSEPGKWQTKTEALGIGKQVYFVHTQGFATARDWLAAADVAVCPRTVCLGFPIKLLNYMAAGKAIVASEGSACGLRHMEEGWIVNNGDVTGMAAAIVKLLDDPALARRLGDSARQTAEREYTWDKIVLAIEEIYEHIGRI